MRAVLWVAVSTKQQAEAEKESLPVQESNARSLCAQNGWAIVDVLTVPGHSRRYVDIHECARDMLREGIPAFSRLIELWDQKGFDILIVRDGSRFARTQALHAYVVERTIDSGARLYSMQDGWVDEHNYRMWIAMSGYSAAGEVDRLVKARDTGMTARARRGLPVSNRVLMSHQLLRDENGRGLRIVVDEGKRRLWNDLAALLLEGVSWSRMEHELYHRFGHVDDDGEPYGSGQMHRLIFNPSFWGNSARHWRSPDGPNRQRTDLWAFDPDVPVPEGVLIFYGTHEPVWSGELAEKVKAELRRRHTTIRGSARPFQTYRFSGLFVCGECEYTMVKAHHKNYTGLYCASRVKGRLDPVRRSCTQTRHLNGTKAQAYIDGILRQVVASAGPELFQESSPDTTAREQIAAVQDEIARAEAQIRRLILKQAAADDVQYLYEQEIEAASQQLKALKASLLTYQSQLPIDTVRQSQERAYEELVALSVDALWQQPDTFINQILHALLGQKRFVVLKGEIMGLATVL